MDALRLEPVQMAPSMGSVGDCYDNAMAESFFATLECELLDRTRFHDHRQAQRAIFEFLQAWYNPHRRHQAWVTTHPSNSKCPTRTLHETQDTNRPLKRINFRSHR